MDTIHHLVFWILVACRHTWSAQNVDGGYSHWSPWSQCSVTCGNGTQQRNRQCTNPPPANNGTTCVGTEKQTRACSSNMCPPIVHGGYSQWSSWSRCSRSCAGGAQRRSRTCTNPPPANGGRDCSELGRATDFRKCNRQNCKVHGGYSQWSSWSLCGRSCGPGKKYRYRSCTNPRPAHGGRECSSLGPRRELRTCNIRRCPVHGGYSQWSSWSQCSKTCGPGKQHRYRSCTNPRPAYGGQGCSTLGGVKESQTCNAHHADHEPRGLLNSAVKVCGKVPVCPPNQWMFRCKLTDSNCRVYYSTCRHMPWGLMRCDPSLLGLRVECCEAQCTQ